MEVNAIMSQAIDPVSRGIRGQGLNKGTMRLTRPTGRQKKGDTYKRYRESNQSAYQDLELHTAASLLPTNKITPNTKDYSYACWVILTTTRAVQGDRIIERDP